MNLIEQLGGYEKALDLFRGCPWDSGTVDVPNPRSKGMFRLDLSDLSHELLEHRRQHNIFEIGDKVVFIHPFELGDLFTVHSICERFTGVKRNNDECIYYAEIVWGLRHATDAEIKAGKRL